MRLKEDKTNWNASNIIRKLAVAPDRPRVHSRKNTAKWCRGVIGREHDYDMATMDVYDFYPQEYYRGAFAIWLRYECLGCGRREIIQLSEKDAVIIKP